MITPDRRLVKQWRAHVRRLVRASPEMTRARRRVTKRWTRHLNWAALRWIVPPVAFGGGYAGDALFEALLGIAMLWSLCVLCNRAQQWATALHAPEFSWFFYILPLDNDSVFAHQRSLLLRSSVWLGIDWFAGIAGWALRTHDPALWILAVAVAAAQWAWGLAAALWLVRFWPRLPYALGATACWLLLFFSARMPEAIVQPLLHFVSMATPAGWVTAGLRLAIAGDPTGWAIIAGLGVAGIALFRFALRDAGKKFSLERIFDYGDLGASVPRAVPEHDLDARTPAAKAPTSSITPDSVRDQLGHYLRKPAGSHLLTHGQLGAAVVRCLSGRQKILADFFQPDGATRWSRGWLIALGGVVVARLLQLAGLHPSVAVALYLLSLLFVLPLFGGDWPGFRGMLLFQQQVGMHSLLPIGFWEATRLILFTNLLRVLAAWPLLLIAVRYGVSAVPLDIASSLDWSFRAILVIVAIQPIWIVGRFSSSSNDTSSRWWFTALLLGAIGLGLILLVTGGVALFAAGPIPAYTVGLGLIAFTHLALAGYAWFYHRGIFDLVTRDRGPVS